MNKDTARLIMAWAYEMAIQVIFLTGFITVLYALARLVMAITGLDDVRHMARRMAARNGNRSKGRRI